MRVLGSDTGRRVDHQQRHIRALDGFERTQHTVSVASRVVPGMGLTMARSPPTSLFNRLDLPALGFPTMAILILSSSSSASWEGKEATSASSRSPVPVPCTAETAYGSPSPNS